MRFRVVLAALAACLVMSSALAASPSVPTSVVQNGSWNPSPYAATFDPGAAATGVEASAGNIDARTYLRADCQVTNISAGASRSVQAECWDPSFASTVGQYPTITVATGQTAQLFFDPDSSGTTHPDAAGSSVTVYPVHPCSFLTVKARAASGVARVLCTLKSH